MIALVSSKSFLKKKRPNFITKLFESKEEKEIRKNKIKELEKECEDLKKRYNKEDREIRSYNYEDNASQYWNQVSFVSDLKERLRLCKEKLKNLD